VAWALVCGSSPETIADAGAAAVKIADAGTTIGCSAGGVIGTGHGVEQVDAVAVWAAVLPGVEGCPIHLSAHRVGGALLVSGLPPSTPDNEVGVQLQTDHSVWGRSGLKRGIDSEAVTHV